jgi:hypothetical protein
VITPELVAALAATVAAILSGLALWLGGARAERQWRRDALVDTIVRFLDASFASPGHKVMRKLRASTLTDQDRRELNEVHRSALTALTRLRVLASANLVECAERLHLADEYAYELLSDDAVLPTQQVWDLHQSGRQRVLHSLLDVARRDLGLGKAKIPDPELFSVGTAPPLS